MLKWILQFEHHTINFVWMCSMTSTDYINVFLLFKVKPPKPRPTRSLETSIILRNAVLENFARFFTWDRWCQWGPLKMSLGKSQGESLRKSFMCFLLDEMMDMFLSYFFGIPPKKVTCSRLRGINIMCKAMCLVCFPGHYWYTRHQWFLMVTGQISN